MATNWTIRTFATEGSHGIGSRLVTVFAPLRPPADDPAPIIYCADGQAVVELASSIMLGVQSNRITPAILVGIHSDATHRSQEYLLGVSHLHFEAHEHFFVDRLPCWLRKRYGLDTTRKRTAVFGFSNGGAFAVSMGLRHPDMYSGVIAFSVARCPTGFHANGPSGARAGGLPRFYLAAGKRGPEKMFGRHTASLAQRLVRLGFDCSYEERDAGHELPFWKTELTHAIASIFGKPDRNISEEP